MARVPHNVGEDCRALSAYRSRQCTVGDAMKGADLKPRAVAALCSLRTGGRSAVSMRPAIGDSTVIQTLDLLSDMRVMGLVARDGESHWRLTGDGLGWLQTNGLDANQEAKNEIYAPQVKS